MHLSSDHAYRRETDSLDLAWLLAEEPAPGQDTRLFCLPPAGGGAASYRKWAAALPPGFQVHRIQPPGRETRFREPFCRAMPDYVNTVARLILREPERPYALFGHSMGALLSYEVAHAVREAAGIEPRHLFASAFRSPHAPKPPPIHLLPDAEFIAQLRDRFGGVPDEVLKHPEILEIMLPIVRADLALLSDYEFPARDPLACPITAIGGHSDPWVHEDDLRGWAEMTRGAFATHLVPGGHFYMDSAIDEVLGIIARALRPAVP